MKNITDFIFESMSFEDKVKKWWNNTKVAPQFVIKKHNHPIGGREEIVGEPYIWKVKLVGIGAGKFRNDEYDEIINIGDNGYEGAVKLKDRKKLSDFLTSNTVPNWTPSVVYRDYDFSHGEQKILTSWDEIRKYVSDRDWEGTLPVYKGPQPKE